MRGSNLPPGVTPGMIPGNRPEDAEWDRLVDEILETPITPEEARRRWKIGNKIADAHDRALSLCGDHRDKQHGKPCLACTIEGLVGAAEAIESVMLATLILPGAREAALDRLKAAITRAGGR